MTKELDSPGTQMPIPVSNPDTKLIVGRILPPDGLWSALKGLSDIETIRNGVLIIFGKEVRGRIGIFCNRYISGGIVDSTGEQGLAAVRKLLESDSGMFGFRHCMGMESSQLAQDVALDIHELVQEHQQLAHVNPAKALDRRFADEESNPVYYADPDSAPMFDGYLGATGTFRSNTLTEDFSGTDDSEAIDTSSALFGEKDNPALTDDSKPFSYLDWFTEVGETRDSSPAFHQILSAALPAVRPAETTPAVPTGNIELYEQLVAEEHKKVIADIERSMRGGDNDQAASVEVLQLFQELLESEHERAVEACNWTTQELDAIKAPGAGKARGPLDFSPSNAPQRSKSATEQLAAECSDLIRGKLRTTDPKAFFRQSQPEEEIMKTPFSFSSFWQEHPRWFVVGVLTIFISVMSAISTMQSLNDAERLLAEGRRDIQNKRFADAIIVLSQAMQSAPDDAHLYFYRGLALSASADTQRATDDFNKALKLGMRRKRVQLALAANYSQAHDYENALKTCQDLIVLDPSDADSYRLMAMCANHLQNYVLATDSCTKALKFANQPEVRARLLLERGYANAKLNKWSEASKDFDEAVAVQPTEAIFVQLGDALRNNKKFADACKQYNQAIRLNPSNYTTYIARGMSEASMHKDREALKDFGRALDLNPVSVEALIQRASVHLSRGQWRLASNDLEDALALNQDDQEARDKLAIAYGHLSKQVPAKYAGRVDVAAKPAAATPAQPADLKTMLALGYQRLSHSDFDTAVDTFSSAVRMAPSDPDARRYLAYAFLGGKRYQDAALQFQALSRLKTLDRADTMSMAKALGMSHHYAEAINALNTLVGSDPSDAEVRLELARLYFAGGDKARAREVCLSGAATVSADKRDLLVNFLKSPNAGDYGTTEKATPTNHTDLQG